MLVRVAPLVGGSGVLPAVGEIDVAGIHRRELRDHAGSLRIVSELSPVCPNFAFFATKRRSKRRGSIEWNTSRSAAPGSRSASPGSAVAGFAGSGPGPARRKRER